MMTLQKLDYFKAKKKKKLKSFSWKFFSHHITEKKNQVLTAEGL